VVAARHEPKLAVLRQLLVQHALQADGALDVARARARHGALPRAAARLAVRVGRRRVVGVDQSAVAELF
jgi:hypothetical protein